MVMKKRVGFLLSLIVIGLLVYLLKDLDFLKIWDLLREIKLSLFFVAIVLIGLMFVVLHLRFTGSLKGVLKKSNSFYLFVVLMAGVFMNTITPGSNVGGEPVRSYYLKKKYKSSQTKFLGAILADKSFNVFVFGLFLIFSVLFVFVFMKIPLGLKFVLEILVILFFAIVLIVFLAYKSKENKTKVYRFLYKLTVINKKHRSFASFEEYVDKRLSYFVRSFKRIFFNKKKFVKNALLSVIIWILIYLASYYLFLAFNQKINFLYVIAVVTLSYLVGDVSPVPGGVGIVESIMVLLYSTMNISVELAVSVTLLSRAIYYFYALIIGGLSLLYLKLRW
jgi:uncharacterized protein (TIRG00374 family)